MATLEEILCEVKGIATRLNALEESQQFIAKQYDDISKLLKSHLEENKRIHERLNETDHYVEKLELRLRKIEQEKAANKVIVTGIPEARNESTDLLVQAIVNGSKLDLTVKSIFRMGPPKNGIIRPLLISLANEEQAQRLIKFSRTSKPNATLIHDKYPKDRRIFFSEYMIPEVRRVWDATYRRAKEKRFKFTWMAGGEIFIRRDVNQKRIKISTIHEAEGIDEMEAGSNQQ